MSNNMNNQNDMPNQRPMYDQDSAKRSSGQNSGGHRPPPPSRPTSSGQRNVYRAPSSAGKPPQPPPRQTQGGTGRPRPSGESSRYVSQSGARSTSSSRSSAARRPARKPIRKRKKRWPIVLLSSVSLVMVGVFLLLQSFTTQVNGENTEAGVIPSAIQTPPEYTGKGIINFLVCGIDYDGVNGFTDEKNKIGNTDMIMYVHYDTQANKVSVLQIPRDTYVGTSVRTGGTTKINGLYQNSEDTNNRMAALANVIYDQFKLPIDFYVTIDMDAVKEIIDIKGTLRVFVPMDVSDPDHPEAMIPAGWRDFTSTEAEFFLRNRKSPTYKQQGDIMRMQMQQSFYSALFREFKSLSPTDLMMWMKVLLYRVKTDNNDIIQLGGLAQKALGLDGGNISFVRPPCGPSYYQANADSAVQAVVTLDASETADLLNQYFRPEGEVVPASELRIYELPRDQGTVPASVKSMADIQASEQ